MAGGQYSGVRRGPFPMSGPEAFPGLLARGGTGSTGSSGSSTRGASGSAGKAAAAAPALQVMPRALYTIPSESVAMDTGSPLQPTTPPLAAPSNNAPTTATNTITSSSNTGTQAAVPGGVKPLDSGAAAAAAAAKGLLAATKAVGSGASDSEPLPECPPHLCDSAVTGTHAASDSQVHIPSLSPKEATPASRKVSLVTQRSGGMLLDVAAPPANARMLYHPTASHADFLLDNGWQVCVLVCGGGARYCAF